MKKLLSVLLLSVLVLSSIMVGSANESKLLVMSKPEINLKADDVAKLVSTQVRKCWNYNININKHPGQIKLTTYSKTKPAYTASWTIENNEDYIHIFAVIDAVNKQIVSLNYIDTNPLDDKTNKDEVISVINEDEAQKIANTFFNKAFSSKKAHTELLSSSISAPNLNDINYSFVYQRKENNAIVNNNYINVIVNSYSKAVVGYVIVWDENSIDVKGKTLTKSKVINDLKEQIPLILQNHHVGNINSYTTKGSLLVYGFNKILNEAYAIDAITGKLIDRKGNDIEILFYDNLKIPRLLNVKAPNTPLLENDAKALIMQYIKDLFGDSYKITSLNFVSSNDTNDTLNNKWQAIFESNNDESVVGQVIINALTREILVANVNKTDSSTTEITWTEGYDKAAQIISKYYPSLVPHLESKLSYTVNSAKNYVFFKKSNGVVEYNNGISIVFDSNNRVKHIECLWDNNSVDANSSIIKEKDAINSLLSNYSPRLFVVNIEGNDEYRLVYDLPSSIYNNNIIDANKGTLLSRNLQTSTNKKVHFAKDQYVTKIEALTYLSKYLNLTIDKDSSTELLFTDLAKGTNDYDIVKMFVDANIIKNEEINFNSNDNITRITLAKVLAKALNYDEIAKLSEIFTVSYADKVTLKDDIGFVAIASKYGFIQPENNKINAYDYVSVRDIYVAIFNLNRVIN